MNSTLQRGVWLGAAACAMLIAKPVLGQTDKEPARERRAVDPETGRNLLNFPPHRSADIRHMRLQLRIPSMNDRTILASETLTVAPIGRELGEVRLNAAHLQVSAVSSAGRGCTFERDEAGDTLTIRMDPPVALGHTAEIVINYRISDPPEGLVWTTETAAHPGRAAQIYSQGESESNRYWFASHDFPNEQMTTEIIATVPRGFQVISNGRLEGIKRETIEPFDTFHWVQERPHVSYLVTMVVGKFDVVDVGSTRLPMPVYVPPGQGELVKGTFGRTPQMVQLLERLTGQPYPWAKYAQVAVWNFDWGGMENTSATTMFESIALDRTALLDGDQEGLIVHELGHQWFGDLVTCKSWEHVWLNEGFATYGEALWEQYKNADMRGAKAPAGGPPTAGLRADGAAYDAMIWDWASGLIDSDLPDAPYQPAMVSKEYITPDEVFSRAANPYPKGALLLHMLRLRLGDEAFFKGVADYLQRHKFQSVETFQFRQAMERASATSLQRFFDQWAYRPGLPRIAVKPTWNASDGVLSVSFEQTHRIDGYNPAFDVRIPVWVRSRGSKDGGFEKLEARFDTKSYTLSAKLAGEPAMIVVDPECATAAEYRVALRTEEWAAQLADGPTMLSRLRAAEALGRVDPSDGARALGSLSAVVRDEGANRDLRIAAAKALGALANAETDARHDKRAKAGDTAGPRFADAARALRDTLAGRIADARVRATVVEQAARATIGGPADERDSLAARLAKVFQNDPSYSVRAAAVRALGAFAGDGAKTTIAQALETDSQHDQIRKAAVGALGELDTPDALELVMQRTAPGCSSALRSTAAETLGKLAHHDPGRVFDVLAAFLDDREPRTKSAAGRALSEIGGERVRKLFESRLAAPTSRAWDGRTRLWLRDIRKEEIPSAGAAKGE